MPMTAAQRLARLRAIQEEAAQQRRNEAARPRPEPSDRLAFRINYLRRMELAGWLNDKSALNELRRLEREIEQDRDLKLDDDWRRR